MRSLSKNFSNLYTHICEILPDVLCVTETWLGVDSSGVHIDGYNFINFHRSSGKRGGGVGMYLRNTIKYKRISNISRGNGIEQLWILAENYKSKILIGVIYRPPDYLLSDFSSHIKDSFRDLALRFNKYATYILGDFNVDLNKNTTEAADFLNVFDQVGMRQLITKDTRVTAHSSTLIDLIFSNRADKVKTTEVIEKHISDHFIISVTFTTKSNIKKSKVIKCRPWHLADPITTQISFLKHHIRNENHTLEQKVSTLTNTLKYTVNEVCPEKCIRSSKPFAPWMGNNEVKSAQRKRNVIKRKLSANPDNEQLRIQYQIAVKNTNKLIETMRSQFLSQAADQEDKGKIWKAIKTLLHSEKNVSTICPDVFNTFYVSTTERLTQVAPISTEELLSLDILSHRDSSDLCKFHFDHVTENDIFQSFRSLKSNKIGSCGVNSNILKMLYPIIREELMYIINCSFSSCIFPNILKQTKIIPVPKTKASIKPENFRPIAIQTTLSKVFELIMLKKMHHHFDNLMIFKGKQFGFRPGLSTVSLLLKVNQHIQLNLNKGHLTVVIFLDFSKAFDTVNHEILLRKLYKYNFSTQALKTIASYLRSRTVRTISGEQISKSVNIDAGVPQGSIIGPTLFNVYVADIYSCLPDDVQILQYADDCQIIMTFSKSKDLSHITNKIFSVIESIKQWAKLNCLCLNENKTQVLPIFNTNSVFSKMNFFVNRGDSFNFQSEARNLGVLYCSNFSLSPHFTNKLQHVRHMAYLLRLLFRRYTSKRAIRIRLKSLLPYFFLQ